METVTDWAELGSRIREARLARGLTQGVLAETLGIDRSALVRLESGSRRATALDLVGIGTALSLPLDHFVFRSPEAMTSRRRPLDEEPSSTEQARYRLDAHLEAHWRAAEALRAEGLLSPLGGVPSRSVTTRDDARALAQEIRQFTGFPTGPLPGLAEVAEKVGLYLLVVEDAHDGASLSPDPGFGVAVLGGDADPGRRRFTAAHEMGHHVLGDEYQSDAGVGASRDERERLVDSFAQELLLPVDELVRRLSADSGDAWTVLVDISATYRLSWSATLRAAMGAQVLSREDYGQFQSRSPRRGDLLAIHGSVVIADLDVGATGPQWRRAVVQAYTTGVITAARAVELLYGALTAEDLPDVDEPDP